MTDDARMLMLAQKVFDGEHDITCADGEENPLYEYTKEHYKNDETNSNLFERLTFDSHTGPMTQLKIKSKMIKNLKLLDGNPVFEDGTVYNYTQESWENDTFDNLRTQQKENHTGVDSSVVEFARSVGNSNGPIQGNEHNGLSRVWKSVASKDLDLSSNWNDDVTMARSMIGLDGDTTSTDEITGRQFSNYFPKALTYWCTSVEILNAKTDQTLRTTFITSLKTDCENYPHNDRSIDPIAKNDPYYAQLAAFIQNLTPEDIGKINTRDDKLCLLHVFKDVYNTTTDTYTFSLQIGQVTANQVTTALFGYEKRISAAKRMGNVARRFICGSSRDNPINTMIFDNDMSGEMMKCHYLHAKTCGDAAALESAERFSMLTGNNIGIISHDEGCIVCGLSQGIKVGYQQMPRGNARKLLGYPRETKIYIRGEVTELTVDQMVARFMGPFSIRNDEDGFTYISSSTQNTEVGLKYDNIDTIPAHETFDILLKEYVSIFNTNWVQNTFGIDEYDSDYLVGFIKPLIHRTIVEMFHNSPFWKNGEHRQEYIDLLEYDPTSYSENLQWDTYKDYRMTDIFCDGAAIDRAVVNFIDKVISDKRLISETVGDIPQLRLSSRGLFDVTEKIEKDLAVLAKIEDTLEGVYLNSDVSNTLEQRRKETRGYIIHKVAIGLFSKKSNITNVNNYVTSTLSDMTFLECLSAVVDMSEIQGHMGGADQIKVELRWVVDMDFDTLTASDVHARYTNLYNRMLDIHKILINMEEQSTDVILIATIKKAKHIMLNKLTIFKYIVRAFSFGMIHAKYYMDNPPDGTPTSPGATTRPLTIDDMLSDPIMDNMNTLKKKGYLVRYGNGGENHKIGILSIYDLMCTRTGYDVTSPHKSPVKGKTSSSTTPELTDESLSSALTIEDDDDDDDGEDGEDGEDDDDDDDGEDGEDDEDDGHVADVPISRQSSASSSGKRSIDGDPKNTSSSPTTEQTEDGQMAVDASGSRNIEPSVDSVKKQRTSTLFVSAAKGVANVLNLRSKKKAAGGGEEFGGGTRRKRRQPKSKRTRRARKSKRKSKRTRRVRKSSKSSRKKKTRRRSKK